MQTTASLLPYVGSAPPNLPIFAGGLVAPNIVSYNSLIYACGRCGDVEGAGRWVTELEARGLVPRVTTYTAVVDACAKVGDAGFAEGVLWDF